MLIAMYYKRLKIRYDKSDTNYTSGTKHNMHVHGMDNVGYDTNYIVWMHQCWISFRLQYIDPGFLFV